MSTAAECRVCRLPGRLCSRCRLDAYCGAAHQKQDWPRHRAGCGAVKQEGGRLRAAKKIPKGTVLIREAPCVIFPCAKTGVSICVGCCLHMHAGSSRPLQCPQCGLPVCSAQCAKNPLHQDECGVLRRARYKMKKRDLERYAEEWPVAVAALRTALAEKRDKRLAMLQTDLTFGREELKVRPDSGTPVMAKGVAYTLLHNDKLLPKTNKLRGRAVQWLRRTAGVTWLSEQELQRAAHLVDIHAHDNSHARPGEREYNEGRIMLGYGQLEHSCVPNTACFPFKGVNNPLKEFVTVANRDIAAGEYFSKDFLIYGWLEDTIIRQSQLLHKFGFLCRCKRCEDVTELGEYVGSPYCQDCAEKGKCHYVVVSKNPAFWVCEGCAKETLLAATNRTDEALIKLDILEKTGADYKQWLAFLVSVQHPNGPLHAMHTLVLKAKDRLRRCIYQRKAENRASDLEMKVWADMCRDLLQTMDKVCPGMHEHRLQILLELRRLLIKHANDAHDELMRVGASSALPDLLDELNIFAFRPEEVSANVTEAITKRKEAAEALRNLDDEFCHYIFGFDNAQKEAFLYPEGRP